MIFIHIPKCGGTAFRSAVQKSLGLPAWLNVWPSPSNTYAYHPMGKPVIMGGHIPFGFFSQIMPDAKHAVILRHPVARIVSYYNFAKRSGNRMTYEANKLSMSAFVESSCDPDLDNGMVRMLTGVHPYAKVTEKNLAEAIHNLDDCICGDTDNMQSFVDAVSMQIGHRINTPDKVNVNQDKEEATKADVKAIVEANRYDMELWDYYTEGRDNG